MANRVGQKGQVVIEKEIRDSLGVQPGWEAVQVPADDHVKLYFIPPRHSRSLAGSLGAYVRPGESLTPDRWDAAREAAWDHAARRETGEGEQSE